MSINEELLTTRRTRKSRNSSYGTHHTRKELEDANFGWVFDCEGIEIEEV